MKVVVPYAGPLCVAFAAGATLVMIHLSYAQQPPAAAPSAPDYSITLSGQDWYQIGEALSDRPFKIANPILQKINAQVTAIATQRAKEAEDKAKPADTDKKPE